MSDDKQAVVDKADVTAKPVADAGDSAREDVDALDALLAEYDQGTKKADTVSPPVTTTTQPEPNALAADVNLLKAQANEWANEKHKRAIAETIGEIRGEVPADVFDDDMVEAWLDAQARKDPRLGQAYLQREQNPRQWGKVKSELSKRLSQKVAKLPDKGVTEDREAVVASLRGASAKATTEPAPKLGQMSNAELRKYTRENFGFDPGV